MTPTKKLQRLIEIAWKNGWRPTDTRQDLISITSLYVDDDLMSVFSKKLAGGIFNHHYETIIFDHSFIKALCKGKYKDGEFLTLADIFTDIEQFEKYNIEPWQVHISLLTVKANRIDYLWEIFGGEE